MKFTGQFQKKPAASSAPIPFSTGMFRSRPFPTPEAQRSPAATPDHEPLPRRNPDYNRMFGVQPKLTVGAPNDVYEQEADRVADQVMSMPDTAVQQPVQRETAPEEEEVQTKPLAASITPLVQREAMPEEEEVQTKVIGSIQREEMPPEEELQTKPIDSIQREEIPEEEEDLQMKSIDSIQREEIPEEEEIQTKSLGSIQREDMPEEEDLQMKPALQRSPNGSLEAGGSIERQLNNSKGGGSPLPDDVRSFMEPRFGTDFSQVRVHTGREAVQMNRDLNAQAFTHKQDVYFGPGKTPAKDALTAHELTHVVQQSSQVVQPIQCKKENEDALAAIQGYAMFNLLPQLLSLPSEVRNDEEAGGFVGGPRLITAMRAVKAMGTQWLSFATARNAELSALPTDQIANIISFLGAPQNARYFKADELGRQFDGAVDPSTQSITLFFRVKFELAPVKIGIALPGTPEWEKEAKKASEKIRQEFAPEFKRIVEEQWSGKGLVKPNCPIGGIKALRTKVVVTVVESGEHMVMYIHPNEDGRSNASKDEGVGNLKNSANETKPHTSKIVDPTGRHQQEITTNQAASAHEFGHAIGLDHSRCPGGADECYGVTAEERRDIMGAGNKVQVIKRAGKVIHDDFRPFEHIAEYWGKDIFPGELAHCNKWSAE